MTIGQILSLSQREMAAMLIQWIGSHTGPQGTHFDHLIKEIELPIIKGNTFTQGFSFHRPQEFHGDEWTKPGYEYCLNFRKGSHVTSWLFHISALLIRWIIKYNTHYADTYCSQCHSWLTLINTEVIFLHIAPPLLEHTQPVPRLVTGCKPEEVSAASRCLPLSCRTDCARWTFVVFTCC